MRLDDIKDESVRKRITDALGNQTAVSSASNESHNEPRTESYKGTSKVGRATALEVKASYARPLFADPVQIRIRHFRHTLCDGDGYWIKYIIDGIVKAGILEDDGPYFVPQPPIQEHFKIEKHQQEYTVVIIEACDERGSRQLDLSELKHPTLEDP